MILPRRMNSNPCMIFYFNHNQYPYIAGIGSPSFPLQRHQAKSQLCTNTWVSNLLTWTGEVLCKVPALLDPPRFGARSDRRTSALLWLFLQSFWVEKHKKNAWTCLKQVNWRRCANEKSPEPWLAETEKCIIHLFHDTSTIHPPLCIVAVADGFVANGCKWIVLICGLDSQGWWFAQKNNGLPWRMTTHQSINLPLTSRFTYIFAILKIIAMLLIQPYETTRFFLRAASYQSIYITVDANVQPRTCWCPGVLVWKPH